MIDEIYLKFGRNPSGAPLTFQASPVTVFVGPNNSGKSRVLSEIAQACQSGQQNTQNLILDRLTLRQLTPEAAEAVILQSTLIPTAGEIIQPDHVVFGRWGHRQILHRPALVQYLTNSEQFRPQFCQLYLAARTMQLNGQSRMQMVQQQGAGDLLAPPTSSFQHLFRDDRARREVRRIIHEAFGLFLIVDPSLLGYLRLRLSSRAPSSDSEERGLTDEVLQFHARAMPIEQASDGVRAFTGIITETIAGDPSVLLIDEPEAFLHPALAFKLGKELSDAAMTAAKRVFISTHSPTFLMGSLQSGAEVNIVRLTYRQNVATARILPNAEITRLMRNPLLRSAGVMGALFYEFVVVTEADTDRAFYQEINERLLRPPATGGIESCLFLNAQNKQTVKSIVKPLRDLGIPAAAIVDIDVLKDGGNTWTSFLECGCIPALEHAALAASRVAIKQQLEATGRDMKRDGGIDILTGADREAANNLLDRLAEYGLFVVPGGEIESWLKFLGITGHGPGWLIPTFERMGENPSAADYVTPGIGDVWDFIRRVQGWLSNPERKGIPA